ncbi:ATP-binding protein [Rhizobium binxianense]|uniref:ATP-binding protein n=1 Tax=Rhizobium binxianense TaxID=3024242 RepID=UPI00234F005E|nr:ATP-binding protein [Rhizobium sp. BC56]MDC7743410.1 ATP-binding protein [Rhizobium sp. BC56]
MEAEHIPFDIETSRVIELLAKQIYQSPLALLRENVQNAFDAVRERSQRGDGFSPRIDVIIKVDRIVIKDNGIGMSRQELKKHFWTAGSSSKNTPEARAAGVVGTFGIGAMANFGVARILTVETESARTSERTTSIANRDTLSLRDDCVEVRGMEATGEPGTTITAELIAPGSIDENQARRYLQEFVQLVEIPIFVNEVLISQVGIDNAVPAVPAVHSETVQNTSLGALLRGSVRLDVSANGVVRLSLTDIIWNGRMLLGHLAIRTGDGAIQTARSGFGLATAPVGSLYSFGGIVDLQVLQPTAGREAITSEGVQLLQSMMAEIEKYVSERLALIDQCNASTPFMQWISAHSRFDLAGKLTIERPASDEISLEDARNLSTQPGSSVVQVYAGTDPGVIKTFSSGDSTLLVLSRSNPRRQCQEGYLAKTPTIKNIPDRPTVTNIEEGYLLSNTKWGVAFRIESIILDDYFVEVSVVFGEISHGVPVLLSNEIRTGKHQIILSSSSTSVVTLLQVYESHIDAFRSLAKDFVRTAIFSHIARFVPSSTRQGAEAFIEAMRRKRETFEYDSDELDELPSIWNDYREGKITLENAIDLSKFSVQTNVQYVEAAAAVSEVVPDLLENERALDQPPAILQAQWSAEPSMMRTDTSSAAKLITIDSTEDDLRGYRCFIALAPRAYTEFGDFFTQPHSTSVVWGGQKVLFIFIHHSGEFGVYYDLQTTEFVGEHAGGGSQRTSTIILKDRIYIPIPSAIQSNFIPRAGQRKRFEIKADLIRTGTPKTE